MITIKVPGCYGITNNPISAVTLFSSSIIFLFNTILYFLNDENKYIDYTLYNVDEYSKSINISLMLMILFYIFDLFLDNSFWDYKGTRAIYVDESEIPHNNRLIVRPMNSHSSIFLFHVGIYSWLHFNENTQYYYACQLFSISHMFMGIISYLWWASNLNNIHMIDNLCMELIVNSISTLIWSTIFPSYELYFVYLSILYFIVHLFCFEKARLVELTIIFLLGSILSSYYYGNGEQYYYFIGSLLTLGGLVPKIADRFNRFQLGTTFFHFMEAYGFLMFYGWIQTISTY
tara:strand:- start:302 stop:1168 length:867 start_codon:yes stop_codon:yes gene_type:complete